MSKQKAGPLKVSAVPGGAGLCTDVLWEWGQSDEWGLYQS